MTTDIKTFSDAVPVLVAHGRGEPQSIGGKLWQVGSMQYDKGGVIALARELAAGSLVLSAGLQDRARRYVAARRRSGDALLSAVAELAAAREEAQHGEWAVFLAAIGLDESTARGQIRIHEAAAADPAFADRIRTGWLTASTARELLAAPPDAQNAILSREQPPSVREIKDAKRETSPALPADYADIEQRFARLGWRITAASNGHRFVLWPPNRANGIGNCAWPNVVERLEVQERLARERAAPASDVPFWQSMSSAHPTAHLWTRAGVNTYRSACGMTAQRAPSGSTAAGHCSRCVATPAAAPAPAPRVCARCGGPWGAPSSMVTPAGKLCPDCAAPYLETLAKGEAALRAAGAAALSVEAATARLRTRGWFVRAPTAGGEYQLQQGSDTYATDADGVIALARLVTERPDATPDALMAAINAIGDEAPASALAPHPCEHCRAPATERRNLRGMLAWRCDGCAAEQEQLQDQEAAETAPDMAALRAALDRAERLGAIYDPMQQRADGRMPVLAPAGFGSEPKQPAYYNADELTRICDLWEAWQRRWAEEAASQTAPAPYSADDLMDHMDWFDSVEAYSSKILDAATDDNRIDALRAALNLAVFLAPSDLTSIADQLSDAQYEALAVLCRPVESVESEVGM